MLRQKAALFQLEQAAQLACILLLGMLFAEWCIGKPPRGVKKAVNTEFGVPLHRRVALTITSVKLKKVSYSLVLHSLTGSTTPITAVPNGKVSSTVNYVLSFRFTRSRFNLLLARVQV